MAQMCRALNGDTESRHPIHSGAGNRGPSDFHFDRDAAKRRSNRDAGPGKFPFNPGKPAPNDPEYEL